MMPNFEYALLFKCIVEEGSLTKAAVKLNTTPSAVSKRLSRLEQTLDTQLIKRTTRHMVLTEAGQFFYGRMKRLQHEWQIAIDETTRYKLQVTGKLIIAAPQPLITRFLLPIIANFKNQHPSIELEILHRQINQLPSLDADISISRELSYYDSHTMAVRQFYQYKNHLFASPNYVEKHSKITSLHDLEHHYCLSYETVDSWHFTQESIQLKNIIKTNNAEIMIQSAKQGLGIAFLPSIIIKEEIESGALVPVLSDYQSQIWHTCLYYLKTDFMPEKLRLFIDYLCSQNNVG